MTKDALLNEQNLKPLLAVYKKNIDWCMFLGNKQIISLVHLYDILVINTHPLLHLGFMQ